MVSRKFGLVAGAATALTGLAAAATLGLSTPAGAAVSSSGGYHFYTIDNKKDLTFNQLLGINAAGVIAGYFGSGMPGHPNKGYTVKMPYHQSDFKSENFPHSAQTQVTGINDIGYTVGFWANKAGANFGWYKYKGKFHDVKGFPGATNSSPPMVQLLGINDNGIAVGFYANKATPTANDRGFEYNVKTHKFSRVLQPGVTSSNLTINTPSLTAAAINIHGTVAGFYTTKSGVTDGFVKRTNGMFVKLVYPGSDVTMTQAFGINDSGLVVGAYTTGSGSSAQTFGFTWMNGHFHEVNDPNGVGSTIINGVNDRGELVGFYMDANDNNNTDGFLAKPKS
jgi:hypothetical protein